MFSFLVIHICWKFLVLVGTINFDFNCSLIHCSASGSTTNSTEIINFQEAVQHFDTIDLTEYSEKIQPTSKHSGFASFIHSIVGPAKLNKSLVPQRNLIFTLALIPFDNGDKDHVRILQTLFKTLTKRKLDCPRFGPHWELIGFQGNPSIYCHGDNYLMLSCGISK